MIADWTEVVLVNKRSWTVRLSYASFYSSPLEWSLTHFAKLSSWKQSVSIIYYTRIHRVAVEFLRNIARSNFRPYDPFKTSQDMLKSLEPISYRSFSITQIIFPSRMFHGMNICHLSSYPVSSKLGSLGPAMWSIFPRITLHFFTVGAKCYFSFSLYMQQRRAKKN